MSGPTMQEYFDIQMLLYRYCWALDTADIPALNAVFTVDVVVENSRSQRFAGISAVLGYFTELTSLPEYRGRRHQFDNLLLTGVPGGYKGKSHWTVTRSAPSVGEHGVILLGYYDDFFQRVGGEWRIKQRIIRRWTDTEGPWVGPQPRA